MTNTLIKAAAILTASGVAGFATMTAIHTQPEAPAPVVKEVIREVRDLPACEYEDSDNCYWDASSSGNGEGASFVAFRGGVYYLAPDPDAEVPPTHGKHLLEDGSIFFDEPGRQDGWLDGWGEVHCPEGWTRSWDENRLGDRWSACM